MSVNQSSKTYRSELPKPMDVVEAISRAIGSPPAALHEPYFNGNEWRYVKDCLDTSFVSSVGKYVDRFEKDLADYTGSKFVVATVNGTAALHIALKLAGVVPGDEVFVPSLTFIATANAVSYCNATPHLVDSEENTLGVSASALREYLGFTAEVSGGTCFNRLSGKPIRAIVPMHTFGHPVDLDELMGVAHDYKLLIVEDAAESLGSFYHGRHTGTFGCMGTFSFNGNKTITTGGGGAIVTDDEELALHAKHLTTTAKLQHKWAYDHDEVGYNYRMPNLNAALGCAQLGQLDQMLKAKRKLFDVYCKEFSTLKGMQVFPEPKHSRSNFWLQALKLEAENLDLRDAILEATNSAGYYTRPIWGAIHKMKPYANCPRMPLTVATSLEKRLINLPSGASLTF